MVQPWEATKRHVANMQVVNAPVSLMVTPEDAALRIMWRRRIGAVDGFVVRYGTQLGVFSNEERVVLRGNEMSFDIRITGLRNATPYFVTVHAYRGGAESNPEETDIVQAVPNTFGRLTSPTRVPMDRWRGINGSTVPTPPPESVPQSSPQPAIGEQSTSPVSGGSSPPAPRPIVTESFAICPCGGDINLDTRREVYVCAGCASAYVQRPDGNLVNVRRLPKGVCSCCTPKRPLSERDGRTQCVHSREEYVALQGVMVRMSKLDYGLCSCCTPKHPLMLNQQGQVVCSVRRDQLYVSQEGRYVLRPPVVVPTGTLDDIDAALAAGGVGVGANGVIVNNPNATGVRPRRNQR